MPPTPEARPASSRPARQGRLAAIMAALRRPGRRGGPHHRIGIWLARLLRGM